jgi:prepilin-type N-terminal cleavage/methylation domain-containing protein
MRMPIAEAVLWASLQVPVPLTPAFSQRERENRRLLVGESVPCKGPEGRTLPLPLLLGEGRGEGDWGREHPARTLLGSRAFTLIELLTVIAIIGVLAALAVPVVNAFKPNVVAAATRQLLDDVAHARQLALSQRTTVYMVFVPTNFWNDPGYGALPATAAPGGLPERAKADRLLDKQLIAYAFVTLHSLGDQPGRSNPRYLSSWKVLPEGAFIALPKFWLRNPVLNIYTNGLLAYQIAGFNVTNGIPFPSESAPSLIVGGKQVWTTLPYLAFNYMGQLVSGQDELIPLAKGTVGFGRNPDKTPSQAIPSLTESPPGNSTNAYNLVRIDWLTGRGRAERLEVR